MGYPLIIEAADFETYWDQEFSLKDVTPPEHIIDKRFEVLGLAHLRVDGKAPHIDPDSISQFEIGEEATARHLKYLQTTYGKDLAGCTLLVHNALYDCVVLAMRYDVHPRYVVDTLMLSRAEHGRSRHGLKELAARFGLPAKGEIQDFKALTMRKRWYRPTKKGPPAIRLLATDDQLMALAGYAQRDVAITFCLMEKLLPLLARPEIELRVQDQTIRMVTKPALVYDSALGGHIVFSMQTKMDAEVRKVMAIYADE